MGMRVIYALEDEKKFCKKLLQLVNNTEYEAVKQELEQRIIHCDEQLDLHRLYMDGW